MPIGEDTFFGRIVKVQIGPPGGTGKEWTSLRMNCSVEKSANSDPDKCKVQIYNLSESSRSACEDKDAMIRLYAGYKTPVLMFQGDIEKCKHSFASPDIITEIEGADGGKAYREGRVHESFQGSVKAKQLINRFAEAMMLPIGFMDPEIGDVEFLHGFVASGPARNSLKRICRTAGGVFKIQDGQILISKKGKAIERKVPLLTPASGLIGSPEKTDKGIKAQCLLQPDLRPGSVVKIESKWLNGFFRLTKVEHAFDSGFESTFYTNFEGKEYKT